jgi:hypothetical protein
MLRSKWCSFFRSGDFRGMLLLAACQSACSTGESLPTGPDQSEILSDYDVESYALRGSMDWESSELAAQATIRLRLIDRESSELILNGRFETSAIRLNGQDADFSREDGQIAIALNGLSDAQRREPIDVNIDYAIAPSLAFRVVQNRTLDPLAGRVYFTNSEPQHAQFWLPCHDRPDDRATIRITLNLAANEDMVANGLRESELMLPDGHREVTYFIDEAIPTYQMAFAAGDLEHKDAVIENLALEVWRRPGIAIDDEAVLADLARQAAIFQEKIGPYPFDRYALVFLPDFSGGMENASATFQGETQGVYPSFASDQSLNAHELAHQWFGDHVTVRNWDDVWIKEGLATHLAAEAARALSEASGAETYLGSRFNARDNEAVYDPKKAPADKYDSGPYGRAAWVFGELRSEVGDSLFFSRLRAIQRNFAANSIDTDTFLRFFADEIGDDRSASLRRALEAQALPKASIATTDEENVFTLTMDDPDQALWVPLELAWFDESGEIDTQTIGGGEQIEIRRPKPGALLVIDPHDIHPYRYFFPDGLSALDALQAPRDPNAFAAYLNLPGSVHELTVRLAMTHLDPGYFLDFLAGLHSDNAKLRAYEGACALALDAAMDEERTRWTATLEPLMAMTPDAGWLDGQSRLVACSNLFDPEVLFAAELPNLFANPDSIAIERFAYLAKFNYAEGREANDWPALIRNAGDMRRRKLALGHVTRRFRELDEALIASTRIFLRDLAAEADPLELGRPALSALAASHEADAPANPDDFAALAIVLEDSDRTVFHNSALCVALDLFNGDHDAFRQWANALSQTSWSPESLAIAADPSRCD